jgi:hypothetical protein
MIEVSSKDNTTFEFINQAKFVDLAFVYFHERYNFVGRSWLFTKFKAMVADDKSSNLMKPALEPLGSYVLW